MESFKHKFYSYMEREDFFSVAGFVSVMGEKLKGFKAVANRILSAKGKEMVILRFHGAVAARVGTTVFMAWHKHLAGTSCVVE